MPFPPTFSSAWDNTFPPDTQLANLLGSDLRTFRTDVQQRMSLQSGTIANRPANMDAIFGGAGYGILYFSTDTFQLFQWNGAAWVDITQTFFPFGASLIIDSQGALPVVIGTGVDQTIYSKVIPAGTISPGKGLKVTLAVLHNAGLNPATFKLKTALSAIETIGAYSPAQNVVIDKQEWIIMNNAGVSNAQTWIRSGVQNMSISPNFSVPVAQNGVASVDWTVNQTLSATCNLPVTDQFTPELWLVENIH